MAHLFHYAPASHPISQAAELAARLARKGVDVDGYRQCIDALRARNAAWQNSEDPVPRIQRALLREARDLKRELFMTDPDLAPLQRVLFVKRHPFRPSHNYSVILDAPWSPGGGICIVDIPRENGTLQPDGARVTTLFDAGSGLARTPMADFDCSTVYFAWKPSEDGYFHMYSVAPDGTGLKQLTDGPYHDYWPCPLPDGGLAFISTRCKRRFLCWRPQAATLFRMNADGSNMKLLSYANLTEWAPSSRLSTICSVQAIGSPPSFRHQATRPVSKETQRTSGRSSRSTSSARISKPAVQSAAIKFRVQTTGSPPSFRHQTTRFLGSTAFPQRSQSPSPSKSAG